MHDRKKLLIVGVDAGDPALLERWSDSGDLPNVRRLLRSGVRRRVINPYALEAGSVWPVFHTGKLPGRQPQYDGRRAFVPEDYSLRWYDREETPPPFWRQLSDQGIRCLIIDPPYSHVDPELNGTMIVDWGGHVPANGQRFEFRAHPPQTGDEVLRIAGPDPAEGVMCDRMGPETVADHRRFRDIYLERLTRKGRLASHMLQHKGWDLALVVTSDLHCTGHHLWHVNDPAHPRYSRRLEAALGEPLKDCYRAFDAALGEMLAAVDPQTTVMLYASHGMGPGFTGTALLDRILLRIDRGAREASRPTLRSVMRQAWRTLPAELRGQLRPVRRHFKGALREQRFLGDQSQRRFFEVYANDATGGIRLNLKGREGHGTVPPEQADALIAHLKYELAQVINAETGEPLAREIVDVRDHYDGPFLDRLPDLLVQWNRNAPIRRVRSDTIGELEHPGSNNRSGDHRPEGLCVVAGDGVAEARELGNVCAADFAPAIADYFDILLADHDGQSFKLATLTETA